MGPKLQNLAPRNPLSVIALFISLIYGISALLLGASVEHLSSVNQDRLVWFVIGFPVLILSAFLTLVVFHHRKLYAPGDYRSDESFLKTSPPDQIGQKYLDEPVEELDLDLPEKLIAEREADAATEAASTIENASEHQIEKENGKRVIATKDPAPTSFGGTQKAALGYLIEGLVFQELQAIFGAPIARDIALTFGNRSLMVDGFVDGSPPTVVEVINGGRPADMIKTAVMRLSGIAAESKATWGITPKIVVAVLSGGQKGIERGKSLVMKSAREWGLAIETVGFNSNELIKRYGLGDAVKEEFRVLQLDP